MNDSPAKQTVVIVGLPNTGKSQVFGRLTGVYSLVANYPQTTVEEKRATCRIGGQTVESRRRLRIRRLKATEMIGAQRIDEVDQ